MTSPFLDASAAYPITLPDGERHKGTVYLNQVIDHPNFDIGDFTYYSDFGDVDDYASHLAPYLFPGSQERLIIGKFCQFAHGTRFITASANHKMDGFSTYPFSVFNPDTMDAYSDVALLKGDTQIGHDVWIGYGATILPGARVASGAIIGAGAVVSGEVPPYVVFAGNPARLVRQRFDSATIDELLEIAWWDWAIETIAQHQHAIEGTDLQALRDASR